MWYLKQCPVCHGDLYICYEDDAITLVCLQCSREYPLPDGAPEPLPAHSN